MRAVFWLLAVALVAATEPGEEPWVEEEDLEAPYNEEPDAHERPNRETYVESPYGDHIRVKRRCSRCGYEPEYRVRRSSEYVRVPRQVHQYEVHEFTDEGSFPSPPYEEMLAASAEHYHRVYAAPGAPGSAHYLQDVSPPQGGPIPAYVKPPAVVSVASSPVSSPYVSPPVSYVNAPVPIAVRDPVAIAEAPVVGPVPVASQPVVLPARQLADLSAAAGHHHHKHSHGHKAGGGHHKHSGHQAAHGGKVWSMLLGFVLSLYLFLCFLYELMVLKGRVCLLKFIPTTLQNSVSLTTSFM